MHFPPYTAALDCQRVPRGKLLRFKRLRALLGPQEGITCNGHQDLELATRASASQRMGCQDSNKVHA